jgi:hypothetical protein
MTDEEVDELNQKAAKDIEDRYWARVHELQCKGFSRGKARRYLDSLAKKAVKKMVKDGKKRQASKPRIDVSDITPESVEGE